MRKIIQPCGFHCIKINNLGVSFGEQTVLEDVICTYIAAPSMS